MRRYYPAHENVFVQSAFLFLTRPVVLASSVALGVTGCVRLFSHSLIKVVAVIFRFPRERFAITGQGMLLCWSGEVSFWSGKGIESSELFRIVRNGSDCIQWSPTSCCFAGCTHRSMVRPATRIRPIRIAFEVPIVLPLVCPKHPRTRLHQTRWRGLLLRLGVC